MIPKVAHAQTMAWHLLPGPRLPDTGRRPTGNHHSAHEAGERMGLPCRRSRLLPAMPGVLVAPEAGP
jgi:hypothetical protein